LRNPVDKLLEPRDARVFRPYPEELPWDLLLDADPSRASESYCPMR
jgi:hypothetical protein